MHQVMIWHAFDFNVKYIINKFSLHKLVSSHFRYLAIAKIPIVGTYLNVKIDHVLIHFRLVTAR
jgi:hypothetical protein